MVLLDELRVTMSDYQKDMDELYEVLGVAAATERYNVLQEEIAKEGFWDDLEHSQKVLQESKTLENRINSYKKMQSELEDIITLIELSIEEGETESTPDMNAECDAFIKKLEEMKLASLLTGEYEGSFRWYSFEQDVCVHDYEWCCSSNSGILYQCRSGTRC